MDAPPPLLSVSKALSSQLQAIPHITQLVDDYLQPKTIDGAVYLDLPLMLRLYGDSRPWTVRAMDGAAARGRLDILQWLQSNRTEGCSSAAFTGAVTGGHLQVLRWLYRLYPELCHPAKEIVVAAVSGQVVMVEFLRSRLRSCEIELALEVAAAYGHVDVVESLVPGSFITSRAFAAAAAHGREEVVKLLLKHGCSDSLVYVNPALKQAAKAGHLSIIRLLVGMCDAGAISEALAYVAVDDHVEVMKLLLQEADPDTFDIGHILEKAARNGQCEAVSVLLQFCSPMGDDGLIALKNDESIDCSFHSGVDCNRVDWVNLPLDRYSSYIGDALDEAVANNQLEVVKLLLDVCEANDLKDELSMSIGFALEEAGSRGYIEMVKVLVAKSNASFIGRVLDMAVANDHLELAGTLLIEKGDEIYRGEALYNAVVDDRIEMVRVLAEKADQDTIERVLLRIATLNRPEISRLLLTKCDSGTCARMSEIAAIRDLVGLAQTLHEEMDSRRIRNALPIDIEANKVSVDDSGSQSTLPAFARKDREGQLNELNEISQDNSPTARNSLGHATNHGQTDMMQFSRCKRARVSET